MCEFDLIVLGGTGFVGKNVINEIKLRNDLNCNIRMLVRNKKGIDEPAITEIVGEIPNITHDLFTGAPNIVLHLGTKNIDHDKTGFFSVNVQGTKKLMNMLPKNTLGIIYGSSFSVYGQNDRRRVSESEEINPQTPLAISRSQAEMEILESEKKITKFILRPRFIVGKNDKSTMLKLIKMYNKRICLGSGNQESTYINVVDYANIITDLISYIQENYHKQEVEILNVGYENPITMKELHSIFADVYGKKRQLYLPISETMINRIKKIKSKKVLDLITKVELMALSHSADTSRIKKFVNKEYIEQSTHSAIRSLLE